MNNKFTNNQKNNSWEKAAKNINTYFKYNIFT